jgi:hypothetical protein
VVYKPTHAITAMTIANSNVLRFIPSFSRAIG